MRYTPKTPAYIRYVVSCAVLAILVAALLTGGVFFFKERGATAEARVAFLNVGQGDAALVESKSGFQTLIDTGRGTKVLGELGEILTPGDKTLDMIVITHPDGDHIGGLESVLEKFKVGHIVVPDKEDLYEKQNREKAVKQEEARIIVPPVPSRLVLPDGLTLEFLWAPDREEVSERNARSVVVKVTGDERSALLTGDIPAAVERELVVLYGEALRSDILKLSHHGSKTSSDPSFLTAVAPKDVVVSAGANNRYGHPHKEVIDRVETLLPNANIHRTSQQEEVIFTL